MAAPAKIEQVNELKAMLSERGNFVVTTYSGLSVEEITALRGQVRAKGARMKVVKNNLFRRVLQENPAYEAVVEGTVKILEGPIAVTFVSEDFPSVSKLLVDYAKKSEKVQVKAGCMEGEFLDKAGVDAVANLPSREELLAIIGRGLNTPATKIATGINQIMASLARGIRAVGEKNGG